MFRFPKPYCVNAQTMATTFEPTCVFNALGTAGGQQSSVHIILQYKHMMKKSSLESPHIHMHCCIWQLQLVLSPPHADFYRLLIVQGCAIISTRLFRILHIYFTHACYELYQTSQVPFLIACARFWALHVGSKCCLYEFTELNFLSVGSQLPPQDIKYID